MLVILNYLSVDIFNYGGFTKRGNGVPIFFSSILSVIDAKTK